jgi:branched-chain amino acid transport system permease protein
MGIDPDRTTAIAWIFAGVLAALGGVLLGASTVITPYILALAVLPAFVAALLGGLDSVVGTVWGSVVVCVALGIVPTLGKFGQLEGAPEVAVGVVAFAAMALRGRRFALADQN